MNFDFDIIHRLSFERTRRNKNKRTDVDNVSSRLGEKNKKLRKND